MQTGVELMTSDKPINWRPKRGELFADRLVRLRLARRMSQEQLASVAGVSRSLVYRLEAEKADPLHGRVDSFVRLARCFGLTIDELIQGIEPTAVKRTKRQET